MCKHCEKWIEIKEEYKWTSNKHPHYHWIKEKIAHNPVWLTEYVEVDWVGDVPVDMYLDVDTNKLNGAVDISYCPFCGSNDEAADGYIYEHFWYRNNECDAVDLDDIELWMELPRDPLHS